MTAILGISAFYHDSAAALVVDGRIVAAAQEERFTRKKHDPSFPHNAITYCLAEGGVAAEALDHADAAQHLRDEQLPEIIVPGDPRHLVRADRKGDQAERDDQAHVDDRHQPPDDRRDQEHGDAGDANGLADHQRAVAAHLGEIARIDVGQAVEADADAELQEAADREITVGEGA